MKPASKPLGTAYRVPGKYWARGYHTGVDYPTPIGTPVYAAADGKVVVASSGGGWGDAYGLHVVIESIIGGATYRHLCAHLDARYVKAGDTVRMGDLIGKVGVTGNTTGPHLHFEVREAPFNYGTDCAPAPILEAGRPESSPAKWSKFKHLKSSGFMDYRAGILDAARGIGAIDIDVKVSKSGTPWALHWGTVGKNGLFDPLGRIKATARIDSLTNAQIARLRSKTGKRVRRLSVSLRLAARKGVRVEVELKTLVPEANMRRLMAYKQIAAMNKRGDLQFKALALFGSSWRWLKVAKTHGGTTVLSFTDYKGAGLEQRRFWPVTDFVRGKAKWL